MSYLRRNRLGKRDLLEASGQDFWTSDFSEEVRIKVIYAITEYSQGVDVFIEDAHHHILSTEGWAKLCVGNLNPVDDFLKWAQGCADDEFPAVIEEIYFSFTNFRLRERAGFMPNADGFKKRICELLLEDRIAFDFIDGQMLPREDQVMHANIILPVMTFLGSDSNWNSTRDIYLKGLKELSIGDPSDAITDFGSATEEFLKKLGCAGNTLGNLISDAVNKGLISPRDKKIFEWIAAERNSGEAHGAGTEEISDGWLMANLVGSVILRWSNSIARRP